MLREIRISDIKIKKRTRKDMGDLDGLAKSIQQLGLLVPIGVTTNYELIYGERRLRACREILRKKTILARVLNIKRILEGEFAENEVRKDFTPSERVAIATKIESLIGNRQGQRTDILKEPVENFPQVRKNTKTRSIAANLAGFNNETSYKQAKKVVESGNDKLIQSMDNKTVSIFAASILADSTSEELTTVLSLDKSSIIQAANEIREKQKIKRKQKERRKTIRPLERSMEERRRATRLIHGDCTKALKQIKSKTIDLILTDPPYPEINREYGKMSEKNWLAMMKSVVVEGRRILQPLGSMVIILQPNYESIGRMRLWLWEFMLWAGREWNLIQDIYWWSYNTLPLAGTKRTQGLLRSSIKTCVWLGEKNCYRNQKNVLCLPSDFCERKNESALRISRSGRWFRGQQMAEIVSERGGSTPFNLIPVPSGGSIEQSVRHPSLLPLDLASWFVKYLLPPNGTILDPFAGSGTTLLAGLQYGAGEVIGIEKENRYISMAKKRLFGTNNYSEISKAGNLSKWIHQSNKSFG